MEQLNNIKVAIVEVSSTNDITPNNTVDEILACEETRLVSLVDYFYSQNMEQLPIHWSFLKIFSKKSNSSLAWIG